MTRRQRRKTELEARRLKKRAPRSEPGIKKWRITLIGLVLTVGLFLVIQPKDETVDQLPPPKPVQPLVLPADQGPLGDLQI